MSERLRPRDLAVLAGESAVDAAAQRHGRDLRPGRLRLRLRAPRRAGRRPHQLRAALPPADRQASRAGWPTRSGSTTPTSTSATTYAAPRCRARARPTSSSSWWRGSSPGRSTGTVRCGRSTSSRASRRARSRCSPSPTRCWSTGCTPSTWRRCCSTARPSLGRCTTTTGGRCRRRRRPGWSPAPLQDAVTEPATVLDTVRASLDSALRSADAFAAPGGRDRGQR